MEIIESNNSSLPNLNNLLKKNSNISESTDSLVKKAINNPEQFIEDQFFKHINKIDKVDKEVIRNFQALDDNNIDEFKRENDIPNLKQVIGRLINEKKLENNMTINKGMDIEESHEEKPICGPILVKFSCLVQNIYENLIYLAYIKGNDKDSSDNNKVNISNNPSTDFSSNENISNINNNKNRNKHHILKFFEKQNLDSDTTNQISEYKDFFSNPNTILLEKVSLKVRNLPYTSDKVLNIERNEDVEDFLNTHTIKLYDYKNEGNKLNSLIQTISVAYITKTEIRLHSLNITAVSINELYFNDDFSKNGVTEFLLNKENYLKTHIENRNALVELLKILFNYNNNEDSNTKDGVNDVNNVIKEKSYKEVEYMILNLISGVYTRNSMNLIGYFVLNIYNEEIMNNFNTNINTDMKLNKTNISNSTPSYKAFKLNLLNLLSLVLPSLNYYSCTLKSLEKNNIVPTFNTETEELSQSVFQCIENTQIVIDETDMSKGTLNQLGCSNCAYIAKLIDYQVQLLEYPYNPGVEVNINNPVLVLSNYKSIFIQNTDKMISFKLRSDVNYCLVNFNELSELIKKAREYIRISRILLSMKEFTLDFQINGEVAKQLQDYFINIRKTNNNDTSNDSKEKKKEIMSPESFSQSINLSRIYAISKGRNYLTYDDFLFIRKLDDDTK